MFLHKDKIDQIFLIPTNLLDLIPEEYTHFFVKNLMNQIDFDDIHSKFVETVGIRAYSKRISTRLVSMTSN
ncbi:hypothetical protein MBCUT_17230 [Methanobrevibacter cuticularis]|uniref:Uncharacterized protein n=1 Tax=Methanobrevibacter cuticularis TaxID=47311 RepID=A0A166D1A3_9EURY|nr:hypothetical protein MBCUT_17230 [Methanobrevibacter cuticularis]